MMLSFLRLFLSICCCCIASDSVTAMTINGKVYHLASKSSSSDDVKQQRLFLQPLNILSPNMTYMHNGVSMPMSLDEESSKQTQRCKTYFRREDDTGDIILVRHKGSSVGDDDTDGAASNDGNRGMGIQSVTIMGVGENGSYDVLSSEQIINQGSATTAIATTTKNDKQAYLAKDSNDVRGLQQSSSCSQYKIIEVAIAYDSTYCAYIGGKEAADRDIEEIIEDASMLYQSQNVCIKLILTHLEGYCNPNDDPFQAGIVETRNSGCTSAGAGAVQGFNEWIKQNRADVAEKQSDTFHLFYADANANFAPYGCANQDSICKNAHGVENMIFSQKSSMYRRATLLAHEMGHNINLVHVPTSADDFIMDEGGVGFTNPHPWSPTSLNTFASKLPTLDCLSVEGEETVAPTSPPTNPPKTDSTTKETTDSTTKETTDSTTGKMDDATTKIEIDSASFIAAARTSMITIATSSSLLLLLSFSSF